MLNAQNRVHYLGPIYERERLFALRQNAFAYIHGHTVGGTNPSLLEAMACGNLVIAKDVEFNREVLGDLGRYFVSADDLTHLLDDVDRADPAAVEQTGQSYKQIITQRFQWRQIVDAYAGVVEDALSST